MAIYYSRSDVHSGSKVCPKMTSRKRDQSQYIEGQIIASSNPTAKVLLVRLTRLRPRAQKYFLQGYLYGRRNAKRT